MNRGHIGAPDQLVGTGFEISCFGGHQRHRAEAKNKDDDIKVTDKSGRIEHRTARFGSVGHGEETHEDVRQASRPQYQCGAQGYYRNWIVHQISGPQHVCAELVIRHGRAQQLVEREIELPIDQPGQHAAAREEEARFDDLDPGGRDHAAETHVQDHQHANRANRVFVANMKKQLDELASPHHLRDQIEQHREQRTSRRQTAHRRRAQADRDRIGKGKLAEILQTFGEQKKHDGPARDPAYHIDQAIESIVENQRGNA